MRLFEAIVNSIINAILNHLAFYCGLMAVLSLILIACYMRG